MRMSRNFSTTKQTSMLPNRLMSIEMVKAIVGIWRRENKIKLVEKKPLVDTVESKSIDLKYNFSLEFLAFPNCLGVGKGCKQPYAA